MGLSGLAFAGADIGGFALSPSPELYTRWLEAGVFYPYCRTHTEYGSRNQEPWSFGNRLEAINRRSIELRYRLLPYLYNAFYEASETGLPVMRALLLDYPDDPKAIAQNYEFLFGGDLLVAPVVKSEETSWHVYLPRGLWYDFWTDRTYRGPRTVQVDAPLERIPVFVRAGAIVPTQQPVEYTGQGPIDPLTFEIYPGEPGDVSTRAYYEDDGLSFDYRHGVWLRQRITWSQQAGGADLHLSAREGRYTPAARSLVFRVHHVRNKPRTVEINGRAFNVLPTLQAAARPAEGWTYDDDGLTVSIRVPDEGAPVSAQIEE
jgi:alpha-glucosidase